MSQNQITDNSKPGWREQRAQERAEHRAARGESGAWILGAIFIVGGILLLLPTLGLPTIQNWWALFILLPAVGSLTAAWRGLQTGGLFSSAVLGPLVVGLVLLLVTAAFLFNFSINWGLIGPALLILVGLGILLGAVGSRRG